MPLRPETVARVLAMWERWPETNDIPSVSVVVIGDRTFSTAPPHLRPRLTDPPRNLDALVELIERAGEVVERFGEARLAYGDDGTLQLPDAGNLVAIADDDPRLAALERAADRAEWLEASADEPCVSRFGVVEHGELLALAALQVWDGGIGHFGVFTRASARGRRLAGRAASAAISDGLRRDLVPQWRSRDGNEASARVADRLGFDPLGRQMFVRVRPAPA
jgi:RimJ/RimL family protein N-acetyltransferase